MDQTGELEPLFGDKNYNERMSVDDNQSPRFEFKKLEDELTECTKYMIYLIPVLSLIGGSLTAPISNIIPPSKDYPKGSKVFLVIFWKFGALLVLLTPIWIVYTIYNRGKIFGETKSCSFWLWI